MQNRQSKVVAILALCVSVVGLTLGFAAFSNTLTISSSATVKPDESDFNINVYGMNYEEGEDIGDFFDLTWYSSERSKVFGKPWVSDSKHATDAKIIDNGKNIVISDISVTMTEPRQGSGYVFLIKNEGKYDVYFDVAKFDALYVGRGAESCTPDDGTSANLVAQACDDIFFSKWIWTGYDLPTGLDTTYKLDKGSYIYLHLDIGYAPDGDRADGPFTVDFDDLVLEFSSVPPKA